MGTGQSGDLETGEEEEKEGFVLVSIPFMMPCVCFMYVCMMYVGSCHGI